ncbi:2Fe-2S iron-sulfur cluster-binding protein [Brevibacterium ihuae]|uniref:2Fe-2S iron-sulfur cluster-binding protein n=1 Tax=Brevibacterium ihuae TaxID=1631743 RepID=UPI000C77B657|nr:FAD-dependent oxidoreductase [Brevibacterium ihuae]
MTGTTARGPHRLSAEAVPHARIDRTVVLSGELAGRPLPGHPGDTLASATLASGILRCGDSLYRARPRGIMTAGVEEPNALVTVAPRRDPEVAESMLTATTVELIDGLRADWVSGQGVLDPNPDGAEYDHVHVHTDVLVVGAGPAGLAAARAAAASGARVILADDQPEAGGSLLSMRAEHVAGTPAPDWIAATVAEFDAAPEATRLQRTSVIGSYDSNHFVAVERRADHLAGPVPAGISRERVWHIRARQVVLATGALEQPLVFAGNDRPGVVLAGAARTYLNRYAVAIGHRIVVATTNDSAYAAAADLHAAGVEVAAIVDSRPELSPAAGAVRDRTGIPVHTGSAVTSTRADADGSLAGLTVHALDSAAQPIGAPLDLTADALAVSGGWSPAVHLHSQRGTVEWSPELAAFVPAEPVPDQHVAGGITGAHDVASAAAQGAEAGARAARDAGFPAPGDADAAGASDPAPGVAVPAPASAVRPLWAVPAEPTSVPVFDNPVAWDDHYVDLQRDQTVADVLRATGAGMRSVEHIKRYTSIGTAHDQGRTSGLTAAGVIARALGADDPGAIGTTRFRAPAVPASFAALAGRRRGDLFEPARTTSIHPWHVDHGAVFEDVGQWKRPRYYPQPGEDMDAAVLRECAAVRDSVGFMDASTLGKIDVRGTDAAEFLNRIYTNGYTKLGIGRARYGVMCTPDGMIFDDGTVFRIAPDHFVLTTTTGGAATVLDWLEEWLQTEWPDLDVTCTSVTEQLATVAVVGPQSRAVVGALAPDLDVSREEFRFMDIRDTVLDSGIPARICRISFSGELAYEINVEAWYGHAVWEAVARAGAPFGITPYGTETMHVLRAEKAFIIVGQDTDGTVTPQDANMEWIVSTKKPFIGSRSFTRADNVRSDRRQLVSILPADPDRLVPEGSQLIGRDTPLTPEAGPVPMEGFVTSSYRSAALGRTFGLALVRSGRARIGETLRAFVDGDLVDVTVGDPVLYDPEGHRRDG